MVVEIEPLTHAEQVGAVVAVVNLTHAGAHVEDADEYGLTVKLRLTASRVRELLDRCPEARVEGQFLALQCVLGGKE